MKTAIYAIIFYALIILIGGLIGYLKAQSSASLITASIFAIWLLVCAIALAYQYAWGFGGSLIATVCLLLFFTYRYYQTHGFMPAGLMMILSVIMLVVLSWTKNFKT